MKVASFLHQSQIAVQQAKAHSAFLIWTQNQWMNTAWINTVVEVHSIPVASREGRNSCSSQFLTTNANFMNLLSPAVQINKTNSKALLLERQFDN